MVGRFVLFRTNFFWLQCLFFWEQYYSSSKGCSLDNKTIQEARLVFLRTILFKLQGLFYWQQDYSRSKVCFLEDKFHRKTRSALLTIIFQREQGLFFWQQYSQFMKVCATCICSSITVVAWSVFEGENSVLLDLESDVSFLSLDVGFMKYLFRVRRPWNWGQRGSVSVVSALACCQAGPSSNLCSTILGGFFLLSHQQATKNTKRSLGEWTQMNVIVVWLFLYE